MPSVYCQIKVYLLWVYPYIFLLKLLNRKIKVTTILFCSSATILNPSFGFIWMKIDLVSAQYNDVQTIQLS